MKRNPKVSVILTSYNHAKYIEDSIKSVLNQSFNNFELIIWDDCSTDNSWEIILGFNDPRIRPFRNEYNQSGDSVRRAIEEVAAGQYIAIHHSDDLWESSKLAKQVKFLDNNENYVAVYTYLKLMCDPGMIFLDHDHPYYDIFDQSNRNRHEWLRYFFFKGNALCMPSVLFRKSIFQYLNPSYGLYQLPDFSDWVQLCLLGEIFILPDELTTFRIHKDEENWSGNKPSTRIRMQFELLKILDHYKNISSIEELLLIFPEAKKFINDDNADILFALGMIAIESEKDAQHTLFGLNLLYDALNDPLRSRNLRIHHGFDKKKFVDLTAKYDIFSYEFIQNLNQIIQKKEQEVLFYSRSKSWQITKPLRMMMSLVRKLINRNQLL